MTVHWQAVGTVPQAPVTQAHATEIPFCVHVENEPHPPLLVRHLLVGLQFLPSPLEDMKPDEHAQLTAVDESLVQTELLPQPPFLVLHGSGRATHENVVPDSTHWNRARLHGVEAHGLAADYEKQPHDARHTDQGERR